MTTIQDLSAFAFERGCGLTRENMLETPKYFELLHGPVKASYVGKKIVAEIQLVGESIADEAFRCLPKKFRDSACQWKRMSFARQYDLAMQMTKELGSEQWRIKGNRTQRDTSKTIDAVLPKQYRSWSRGPIQPNCLGMSQMLIGFARKTGAKHYFAWVIRQADTANERSYYRDIVDIQEWIKPFIEFPGLKRQYDNLEKARLRVLQNLTYHDRIQAHHLLVIESRKGWMVIDPYLNACYLLPLQDGLTSYLPELEHHVDRVVQAIDCTVPLATKYEGAINSIKTAVGILQEVAEGEDSEKAFSDLRVISAAFMTLGSKLPQTDWYEEIKRRRLVSVFYKYYNSAEIWGYLPHSSYDRFRKADSEERKRILKKYELAAKKSSEKMISAIANMTDVIIDQYHIWNSDAAKDKKSQQHPVLEIAHSTYGLGLATLNHIASKHREAVPELVMCSSAQWILHDTLWAVTEFGTTRQQQRAVIRLRKVGRLKNGLLWQLNPHLQRGYDLGKAQGNDGTDAGSRNSRRNASVQ